ncbi:hypothetical protein B0I35DRAFT_383289 [Stachybotrys elegans]|uniref:Uncharacterized protein n=1 Tax=Stachybotrys elegans TaxID=80388 RepID=A0A8K0WJX6_9HYPO|nr:hypothetical protein B0I35DRAFT_383289 [Stachybotrys elegans]
MYFIHPRNDALRVNPQAGDEHLSEGGSDWLWAAMAIFLVVSLITLALSFRPPRNEKIFHYLFIIALFTGGIAYFAMASGIAYSVIPTHLFIGDAATYQVFFAKYIFWVVAFPAIIIALGLASLVSWATIIFNVFLSWIWIISYLCSAYTRTRYKWGFYAFGTVAYFMLAYQTLWAARSSVRRAELGRDHGILSGYVNLFWLMYPIAYAVSEGANVIGTTQSLIFFGILDVFLVCGSALAFIFLARRWDYGRMNLYFTQYGRVEPAHGLHPEKAHTGTYAPAPGTGSAAPAGTDPAVHGTTGHNVV